MHDRSFMGSSACNWIVLTRENVCMISLLRAVLLEWVQKVKRDPGISCLPNRAQSIIQHAHAH